MKTLLVFLAFVVSSLTACDNNYQSVPKAEKACADWASQGIQFTLEPSGYLESIEYNGTTTNRFCERKNSNLLAMYLISQTMTNLFSQVADELIKLRGGAKPTQKFRW